MPFGPLPWLRYTRLSPRAPKSAAATRPEDPSTSTHKPLPRQRFHAISRSGCDSFLAGRGVAYACPTTFSSPPPHQSPTLAYSGCPDLDEPLRLEESRILIVDDEPRNVLLLERLLEASGFSTVHSVLDPQRALPLCRELLPDLVILDLHMPGMDGLELMSLIARGTPRDRYLPILVLTADATERAKRRALAAGAHDFLTKPFNATEAILRIRNLLETRALYNRLARHNEELAERVAERTRELEATRLEVLERLCQAVEFRDDITGQHTRRVGERAAALAERAGLSLAEIDLIRRAAPLHDVGKVAIPDSILLKPGRLTADEFAVMREHTTVGARILSGGSSELMTFAESIAHAHHERWDGAGYPNRLAADEIPLAARVVAIVDVFDALTAHRHYRTAWPPDRAAEEIRSGAGTHFDPELVEAFSTLITSP
jgi:putative two-component system response regulator